ncbi:PREDICTED: inactive protein RESTRICTED TEV MOVEMENT 1-like [Nicotiana attenuata]|uniref:Inactive protein restricted tev movement 1 n=1 Tax=Nicotiana attenuata TaxID=49451 RepID=A0A314L6G3_NICAT|nr:PREDICTED: inactive protein RESTRICTED TEV MOVEMENT 1-like [Nicotiana attenuata]OIT37216.1 inactive protein restricted tev movement 1 [Nicotiana attenuata]
MIKVGPVRGHGGTIWDEKGRDQVAGVLVSYNKNAILSLQFMYYENGNLVKSNRHGVVYSSESYSAVIFDYPSEYFTSISGSLSPCQMLTSIIFRTNKDSYGPFGTPSAGDQEFNIYIGRSLFDGFYGSRNGDGINGIGVYVKNTTSSMINSKDPPQVKVEKEDD